MKTFLLLVLISLIPLVSHAQAASAEPSVKDYLKDKGATYVVRFWELRWQGGSSKDVTTGCQEGLLANDIQQAAAPYASIGTMTVWHNKQISVQFHIDASHPWIDDRQGTLDVDISYWPNLHVGYPIGGAEIGNLGEFKQIFSATGRIQANGRAYRDVSDLRKSTELGATVMVNYPPATTCAFFNSQK